MSASTDHSGFEPRVTSRSRETTTRIGPAIAAATKSTGSIALVSRAKSPSTWVIRPPCSSEWASCAHVRWKCVASRTEADGCRENTQPSRFAIVKAPAIRATRMPS